MKAKQLMETGGQKTFALVFDTGDEVMQAAARLCQGKTPGRLPLHRHRGLRECRARLFRLAKKGLQANPCP